MRNRTADANPLGIVVRSLAVGLLTIGACVASARAGSNPSAEVDFARMSPEAAPVVIRHRSRVAQACAGPLDECSDANPNIPHCCQGLACVPNPNANGRTWCEAPATPGHCTPPAPAQCFEAWSAEFSNRANGYDGGPEFNQRKPWSINRYGLFEGGTPAGPHSVGAPDDFFQFGNNKYCWMWAHYTGPLGKPWSDAGVPPLQPYVQACARQVD